MIIYANDIINNSEIQSNGSSGANTIDVDSPGGSSGGGSVNIFYKQNYKNDGNINVTGGSYIDCTLHGATRRSSNGGNGTITVGTILNGTFEKNNDE